MGIDEAFNPEYIRKEKEKKAEREAKLETKKKAFEAAARNASIALTEGKDYTRNATRQHVEALLSSLPKLRIKYNHEMLDTEGRAFIEKQIEESIRNYIGKEPDVKSLLGNQYDQIVVSEKNPKKVIEILTARLIDVYKTLIDKDSKEFQIRKDNETKRKEMLKREAA